MHMVQKFAIAFLLNLYAIPMFAQDSVSYKKAGVYLAPLGDLQYSNTQSLNLFYQITSEYRVTTGISSSFNNYTLGAHFGFSWLPSFAKTGPLRTNLGLNYNSSNSPAYPITTLYTNLGIEIAPANVGVFFGLGSNINLSTSWFYSPQPSPTFYLNMGYEFMDDQPDSELTNSEVSNHFHASFTSGPQYSISRGTHPNLIQSPNISLGFGLFTEWDFNQPHSLELDLNTVSRSVRLRDGPGTPWDINQTSIQLQLVYRYQMLQALNLGVGAHFDTNIPTPYGYVNFGSEGSSAPGYTQITDTRPNYGITLSLRYQPSLGSWKGKPFIDFRYLYSLNNFVDGNWANQAIDPKISQLQLFLGFHFF